MSQADFVDRMNHRYFDGNLPPGFVDGLRALPTDREDVEAFVERVFRFMGRADMRADDLSTLQGHILGSLIARILPGAWNGRVPPITLRGRHQKIDRFIADNRFQGRRKSGRLLDLGCGFPPETTLDTADHLPAWTIHGADPSMPSFVVHDQDGAYATFDAEDRMIYCQPAAPTVENWNALLMDHDATARRFLALRDELGGGRPAATGNSGAGRLVVDPAKAFERAGLSFGPGGIGDDGFAGQDVVRCFNVLYYFTDEFRQKALEWFTDVLDDGGLLLVGGDWAFTTECRYFVYQKEDGILHPREFSFSLDNVLPFGVVPFFTLHDKDRGLTMLSRLIRILRRDERFLVRYYEFVDRTRQDIGVCARDEDGWYGTVAPDMDPVELWGRVARTVDLVADEFGEEAVAVLERAGWEARLNEIGMVTVSLDDSRG